MLVIPPCDELMLLFRNHTKNKGKDDDDKDGDV